MFSVTSVIHRPEEILLKVVPEAGIEPATNPDTPGVGAALPLHPFQDSRRIFPALENSLLRARLVESGEFTAGHQRPRRILGGRGRVPARMLFESARQV